MKNKSENKGQASIEYMVMLAISLLIFSAILIMSLSMVSSVNSQMGVNTAFKAVEELKEAADFVYIHGHPSKIKRSVNIPDNVENVTINGSLVRISVSTGRDYTDVYDISKANITAEEALAFICRDDFCRGGNYVLSVQSQESGYDVNITVD